MAAKYNDSTIVAWAMRDILKMVTSGQLIVFILFANATLWIVVTALLSRMSGWRELAQRYAHKMGTPEESFSFQTASFRWAINYRSCITIGLSPEGLSLSILKPFRMFHPSILIPWSVIRSVDATRYFFYDATRIQIGQENGFSFFLIGRSAAAIRHYFKERLQR